MHDRRSSCGKARRESMSSVDLVGPERISNHEGDTDFNGQPETRHALPSAQRRRILKK